MAGKIIPITNEERKRIEVLLRQGLSMHAVSKCINRSPTGVQYEINRGGGRKDYTAAKAQLAADGMRHRRHMNLSCFNKQKWEKFIEIVKIPGLSIREMSNLCGINRKTISVYLNKVDESLEEENEELETRVAALEMQLEIIHQQLRGLNDRST